ncbi:MAG: tetratricopeptide repeat protein [Candidatus Thorarchaeota archaeon]|nr:tetratricopeptide repeat protein [Candidatus Thorarchaeota archaeon]
MIEQIERIQPFSTSDGEYVILVEFAIRGGQLLDPSFRPTDNWSERVTECVPYEYDTVSFYYGEKPRIVEIKYRKGFEPKAYGNTEDEVIVTCQGLPDGMKLELRVLRFYQDPRYIEIRVAGLDEIVHMILEGFERRFSREHVPQDREMEYALRNARAAVQVHAWRAAELNAHQVLKHEPYHAEATMYLGIAKAAQGYEPEGENLLLASLTLNPRNVNAYYSLGLIVLNQGRCILASDAFRKGLSIEPANHSLYYQLGRALERLGNMKEALEAYQQALKHSPNPEQMWGYSGMDFTSAATESIIRINNSIQSNQVRTGEHCTE